MKNREIKFRVWASNVNRMLYWNSPNVVDILLAISNPDDAFPVMQYTGLKDKNGHGNTCLYEGDVLSLSGELLGNKYENKKILEGKSNYIIEGIGTKNWRYAEKIAMDRGWGYPI